MKNFTKVNTNDIENLAAQLRCPTGKAGKYLGHLMYDSNRAMIETSIDALQLRSHNRVLEIGPGNGFHLRYLLKKVKGLRYFGLDISETMINESIKNNSAFIEERNALFHRYDGYKIDYVQHWFDRILTVNTIYFWKKPVSFMNELHRVLKPDGYCVITFVNGDFMKDLPFVDDTFRLYNSEDVKNLILQTRFEFSYFQTKKELIKSKSGEMLERIFTIVILLKNAVREAHNLNISKT